MSFTDLRNLGAAVRRWPREHKALAWFLLAALVYAACARYYMGVGLTQCATNLMGGPGDQTAGLIWLHTVSPHNPFWGFTHVTGYPFGENLGSPVNASGGLEYIWYWILASLTGSVCGYNLLNAAGFIGSALVMFGFIRWLTGKPWVALLAGYAVSFTPYLQIKTAVHPSYAYQGLLIGLLWLFLRFWTRPRLSTALGISGITASAFYLDPYFVLLAGVMIVALLIAGVTYNLFAKVKPALIRAQTRYVLASLVLFLILLAPLAFIRIHYAAQINTFVTSSRNDIKFDADIYSAHPLEYLRPVATQPVLTALIPGYAQSRNHHNSNPAEYTINISLTLIGICLLGVVVWLWRYVRRKRVGLELAAPLGLVITALVATGALAFAFSLPPVLYHHRMPTWYLTNYVTMWRVFARLAVVVNIAIVSFAALALVYLLGLIKAGWVKVLICLGVFILIAFEYQIGPIQRPTWSYATDVPTIYQRLHDNKDIDVIAEYSLDEPPITAWPTYYMTYQRVHGKQMVNSDIPASPQAPIRSSLRDLSDPQSVPALRALGADAIVVHGVDGVIDNPSLTLVDYEAGPPASQNPRLKDPDKLYPIAVYRLNPGAKASYVVAPLGSFVYPKMFSSISYDYVGGNHSTIELMSLPGTSTSGTAQACFNVRSELGGAEPTTIRQGNTVVWQGTIGADWQRINVAASLGHPLSFTDGDPAKTSLVFDKLGCQ